MYIYIHVYIYTYTYTVCTCVYIIIKLCSAVEYINMYFIYVYTKNTHAYVNVNYSMHILSANTYTCTEYGCSTGNLHILQLYTHVYSYMYVGYVMVWYGMSCHVMSCHVYIYIYTYSYTHLHTHSCATVRPFPQFMKTPQCIHPVDIVCLSSQCRLYRF